MKKILINVFCLMLTLALLAGCASSQGQKPSAPAADPTTEATQASTTETTADEIEATTHYIQNVYPKQIQRYHTAISQKWDESTCLDNEMSSLVARYYEGKALDNVGFAFMDLDGDGIWELIIGAAQDPLIFEIWKVQNGEPVMLAQSGSHNRYYLQYAKETDQWTVAYEAENGAANHAVYQLQLVNGQFQVIQGVVFDALANEKNPWFQTADLDWNVANDKSIDEQTATKITSEIRSSYAFTEYFPYSLYQ